MGLPNRLMPGESEYKPGVMMKNLALSLADGAAWSKIRSKHHVLHEVLLKEILYHTRASPNVSLSLPHRADSPGHPEAPGSKLKRLADAAAQEEGALKYSAVFKRISTMTKDNLKNAERDFHAVFSSCGLTIPVPISMHRFGLLHLHYLSLENWFSYLISEHSRLLFGGFDVSDGRTKYLLGSFWKKYQVAHGDHWVFSNHTDELNKCIPYYLHLDEGTGQRKSGVLVFNMQSLWGLDTKTKFERAFHGNLGRSDEDFEDYMTRSQCHNQSGSSFLSRFLYTIIPKKWYSKKFSFVYDKVLEKLAAESRKLASTGVKGWYPICLGVKGDAPALAKAAHYTRSFLNLPIKKKQPLFLGRYNQIYLSLFYGVVCSCLYDHVMFL